MMTGLKHAGLETVVCAEAANDQTLCPARRMFAKAICWGCVTWRMRAWWLGLLVSSVLFVPQFCVWMCLIREGHVSRPLCLSLSLSLSKPRISLSTQRGGAPPGTRVARGPRSVSRQWERRTVIANTPGGRGEALLPRLPNGSCPRRCVCERARARVPVCERARAFVPVCVLVCVWEREGACVQCVCVRVRARARACA